MNVSNTCNNTKLTINDVNVHEIKKLKERWSHFRIFIILYVILMLNLDFCMTFVSVFINPNIQGEIPLLFASNMQLDMTQNSQYSEIDKFLWKAKILEKLNNLQNVSVCFPIDILSINFIFSQCVILHHTMKPHV